MPSLKNFLDSLPDEEKLVISEPTNLDFLPTALVLELEARKRFPVVCVERPEGFDVPVVMNLFSDRNRIARMVGVGPGEFGQAWGRALENLVPPVMAKAAPVHEV